ncbi:flavodoxin domain-containing protein [Candidatus Peregrinibacteria bacterium]|nr:flavodoxin domain-containing protein [Candidatus Peregrinibacteria bacterium]
MTSIVIVYGSTGGNTEMVAEYVADFLKAKKIKADVKRAEQSSAKDLLKYDACILASPTYGHGLLEAHMTKFAKGLKEIDLKGRPCAVIGLGDPKYEMQYHIESAPILEKKLTAAGGKILLPALRISRTPVMHLKGIIPHWTKQLINLLK